MHFLILLGLTIGPGIAIAYYIYLKDKFEKEPRRLLIQCFFLGALSLFPALILEVISESYFTVVLTDFVSVAIYSFLIIGLSEELSKYIFLKWFTYDKKSFNEPFDGIVYSIMIGMGFATLENIFYVYSDSGGFDLAILRMFMAIPAHAIFGIMMGYFVGLAKFEKKNDGFLLRMTGLIAAIIFHGGYDFFLLQGNYTALYSGAVIVVITGIVLSKHAIKIRVNGSPFKKII